MRSFGALRCLSSAPDTLIYRLSFMSCLWSLRRVLGEERASEDNNVQHIDAYGMLQERQTKEAE